MANQALNFDTKEAFLQQISTESLLLINWLSKLVLSEKIRNQTFEN
jgi:hypothetical protein